MNTRNTQTAHLYNYSLGEKVTGAVYTTQNIKVSKAAGKLHSQPILLAAHQN